MSRTLDRSRFRERALSIQRSLSVKQDGVKFLWEVHHYINEYIRFADTKAAFTATACTALIGSIVASKALDSIFLRHTSQWLWSQKLSIIALILLTAAVLLCIWSIRPRLPGKNPTGGPIFWESIVAHGSPHAFFQYLADLHPDDRVAALSDHVYVLASIAKKKYSHVSWAVWLGLPGGIIAGAALFIQHAAK
jgi:hypothetical protein